MEDEKTTLGASGKSYLIALVQESGRLKAFGSPYDRVDCDEILEINGKSFGSKAQHCDFVRHIHECIKLRNISLKVRKSPFKFTHERKTTLLDVFVIGTDARQQLERFFRITNFLATQRDLLKLNTKMEMLELGNASQTVVGNNGNFINQHQQIIGGQPGDLQQMDLNAAHLYRNHHQQQQQQQQQNLRYANNPKVSKHRELPVDVPDSFVGMAKQSPRYPPPKPHRQVSPPMPVNNLTTFNHTPQTMPYIAKTDTSQHQQPAAATISPLTQNTTSNIAQHNNSLRSSIKLKQLEKSRGGQQNGNYPVGQMQPAINQAFELNEEEMDSNTNSNQANTCIQQQQTKQALKMKQSMPDLCSIYNRLQRNLNGDFNDVTGDAKFAKLLSIYNTIVQTHNKQFRIPNLTSRHATTINIHGNQEPLTYKVSDLLQSVGLMFRDEEMTNDAAELLYILYKHEVDGVCSAFDRIVQSFEFAKSSRPSSPLGPDSNVENTNGHFHQQNQPMYNQTIDMHQYQGHHHMDDYDYAQDQVQMDIENNLYQNSMHPLTDIDLSDGICTKTVHIKRGSTQALGATIKNEEDGSVVIGRIVCGGGAYESGMLHEGDEILEVNGIPMRGKNINEVVNILEQMDGTLTFKINVRSYNKPSSRGGQEKTIVRAFFNYDAENDAFMPCKELGLSFEIGEILVIIDRSDPKWWQAQREGDREARLAGLIPSVNFLKQREKDINHEDLATTYFKHEKKNLVSLLFNCPRGNSPRRRKKSLNLPIGPDEIPYYEEVCVYYPDKYKKRPIILVGPKMIGQREIVAKLLQDSSRFANAISHTSKPRQEHERNGVDFHFVSRAQFEADMKAGKFIECGQYQNQYYGTSFEAMEEVVKSKKTCVHLVNTPSIFNFRQGKAGSQLKPFFVFIKPDDSHPDKLRNLVSQFLPPKSNLEENIKAIMAEVETIETHYLPYLDLVITVSDIDRAYMELLYEIDKIETNSQWIPMFWKDAPAK